MFDNWSEAALDPNPLPDYLNNLAQEIISNVTEEDLAVISETFLSNWDIEAQMLACASYGIKDFDMGSSKFHTVSLDQLSKLLFSKQEIIELENISEEYRYLFLHSYHVIFAFHSNQWLTFFSLDQLLVTITHQLVENITTFIENLSHKRSS